MTFFVGDRKEESCKQFVSQVAHVIGEKSKPLFASDELPTYASALEKEFGKVIVPEHTGKQGRPRLPYSVPADDLDYVTVHKTREGGRVVKVEKRIVFGNVQRIDERMMNSPSSKINTSFVERHNGILRQMDSHLKRKALTFAKSFRWLKAKLGFVAAFYNFVRPHGTLCKISNHSDLLHTPAMAVGLSNHAWTLEELMTVRVTQ
ncbi:MAG: hypothetical protein NTV58_15875 [Deltaproteobacteria bacterium]|nr:hypothetical protein [Deltaproteobacteria bacterium]